MQTYILNTHIYVHKYMMYKYIYMHIYDTEKSSGESHSKCTYIGFGFGG